MLDTEYHDDTGFKQRTAWRSIILPNVHYGLHLLYTYPSKVLSFCGPEASREPECVDSPTAPRSTTAEGNKEEALKS